METAAQTGSAREEGLQIASPGGEPLTRMPAEIAEADACEQRSAIRSIPVEVDVSIPIRRFRVRDVLALNEGQVIATRWLEGEDMPLAAHGTQLAWSEIEVIDQRLAVRITRLA